MSDIFFDWIKASWNEEYLICYKRGEICNPIFMLDKQDVEKLKESLKEQPQKQENK